MRTLIYQSCSGLNKHRQPPYTITIFRGSRAEKAKYQDDVSGGGAAERAVDFESSEGIEFLTPPSTPPVLSSPMFKPAATARHDVSTGTNKSPGTESGCGGVRGGESGKRNGRIAQTGISSRSATALTTATSVMMQAQRRRMRSASPFQGTGEGAHSSAGITSATRRRVASMSPTKSAARLKARTNAARADEQADRLPRWWSKSVPLTASLLGSGHTSGGSQVTRTKTRSTTNIVVAQGGKEDDKMEGGKVGEEDESKQTSTPADAKSMKPEQVCAKSRFESMSEHEIITMALKDLRLIREVGLQAAAEVRMA